MATVVVQQCKQVEVTEDIEIPAPSFWITKYGAVTWVREDMTTVTVLRTGIFTGKVSDTSFRMEFPSLGQTTREAFQAVLKSTQRHLLTATQNL